MPPSNNEQTTLHLYWGPALSRPRSDAIDERKADTSAQKDNAVDIAEVVDREGLEARDADDGPVYEEDIDPSFVGLSKEQKDIMEYALGGGSFFYTGSAGTGKSFVLRSIIRALQRRYGDQSGSVVVTATTGSAACSIGGVTAHSFAGIGLGLEPAEVLARRIGNSSAVVGRWRRVRVLVMDEVSMMDAEVLDKLAYIAGVVRESTAPFGGIQVIATSDFLQLPPVNRDGPVKFAFEARAWQKVFSKIFVLRTVFRQRDPVFAAMLNDLRLGRVSDATSKTFQSLARPLVFPQGPEPTELFPLRQDVEFANLQKLRKLATPLHEYSAHDTGLSHDRDKRDKVLSNVMAPKHLPLRVGAQVMLVKNIDGDLVNGSVGRVVRFVGPDNIDPELELSGRGAGPVPWGFDYYPVVSFCLAAGGSRDFVVRPELFTVKLPSGDVQASRLQLPLILAWAISIHKAQGKSLARVIVDLKKVFERGQVYVALSRAMSMDGLQVLNFNQEKVRAHPRVIAWHRRIEEEAI